MIYEDRREAGQALARRLLEYSRRGDVIVLALPRGGVPVAYEVAAALEAPLDIFLVRKLGAPGQEELAMGAIASGGIRVLNPDVAPHFSEAAIEAATQREQAELERRELAYRGSRPAPEVHDRTVILVDDGLATGSTMRAAVDALRKQGPKQILVAVPVGARSTCLALRSEADAVICGLTPEPFYGVGQWYENFDQTSDEEVRDLLERARSVGSAAAA